MDAPDSTRDLPLPQGEPAAPEASTVAGVAGSLSSWDEDALRELHFHWSEAYAVSVEAGTWRARPHADPSAVLEEETAEGLRVLIRADYGMRAGEMR